MAAFRFGFIELRSRRCELLAMKLILASAAKKKSYRERNPTKYRNENVKRV
jgi:hypothetical protein